MSSLDVSDDKDNSKKDNFKSNKIKLVKVINSN